MRVAQRPPWMRQVGLCGACGYACGVQRDGQVLPVDHLEGGGAYRALIDRARDVELLVLDERWRNGRGPMGKLFGVEGATQNALMVLADIIRSRIDHRQPILFTSKHKADSIMQLLGDSTWYRIRNDIYSAVMGPVDMRDE